MFSDILDGIGKLLDLIQQRRESRNEDFKELFDPLFQELLLVHKDYLSSFGKLREMLRHPYHTSEEQEALQNSINRLNDAQSSRYNVMETAPVTMLAAEERAEDLRNVREYLTLRRKQLVCARDFIAEKRFEFEPTRQKLIAVSSHYPTFKSAEESSFLASVHNYFLKSEYLERGGTPGQRSISLIDLEIAEVQDNLRQLDVDVHGIAYLWLDTVPNLTDNWSKVCDAYAALKIASRRGR